MCICTYFAFAINSFNNNLSWNCYGNNVVIKKKWKNKEREKKKRKQKKNAHCDIVKITILLLYITYNCLLYCCTTVYVCIAFFCSLSLPALLFIFAATVNILISVLELKDFRTDLASWGYIQIEICVKPHWILYSEPYNSYNRYWPLWAYISDLTNLTQILLHKLKRREKRGGYWKTSSSLLGACESKILLKDF